MAHKIQIMAEMFIGFFLISWQPIFGSLSAICGAVYYISMLKTNVVDKKYGGSWKTYIKSISKIK